MADRRVTRASNVLKRPGLVDLPEPDDSETESKRPRSRSQSRKASAEVEETRVVKANAKKAKADKVKNDLDTIAEIEDDIAAETKAKTTSRVRQLGRPPKTSDNGTYASSKFLSLVAEQSLSVL